MNKKLLFWRVIADSIMIVHFAVVIVLLFGWAIPHIYYLYIATLIAALFSALFLGYCLLSKWEFDIRKKINPELNYDYSFLSYYLHQFLQEKISTKFIKKAVLAFLSFSLILQLL